MSKAFARTSFCNKGGGGGSIEIQNGDVTVVPLVSIINFSDQFTVTDNGGNKVTVDFSGVVNLDNVVTSQFDASGNKNLMGRAVVIDNSGDIVTI